ncbi:MAG TPA: hypothetical protein VGJ33_06450 [Candidatus Angelobacter sp.]|jgi:tetratricopeptide (TPR) repeat protein
MIAKSAILVAFVVCLAFAARAQNESKAASRAELISGVQAYELADYENAIQHFEKAVDLDPASVVAHSYLATACAQLFVPGVDSPENVTWATKALEQYKEVLDRDPANVLSAKGMAYINMELKNFDTAKENYKKVAAMDPNDPESFYSVGVMDWSMATRDIKAEKVKLDADSEDALFLSESCTDARVAVLSNIDDGIDMLAKAITMREDYADAMVFMNLLYRLRADVECSNQQAHDTDLKQADEWSDKAMAAGRKKAEATKKNNQDSETAAPPR